MDRIYFDFGSASPVDPRVIESMEPFLRTAGNPSSLTQWGLTAKRSLEASREKVARLIGADSPKEIVFTSGSTESNNLATSGITHNGSDKGKHIIVSAIEHVSVLNPCKNLMKQGFDVSILPVDSDGMVDPKRVASEIRDDTLLVSVMYANGEIGTIEPIKEIGAITRERGVAFHVDGTAACGKIPVDVINDSIDLLTISSNDMQGPQGIGALYVRRGIRLHPLIFGGGQEKNLRSGTENIAAITGMGVAAELAEQEMHATEQSLIPLRDMLLDNLSAEVSDTSITGSRKMRLPNHASLRFSYIEGESIILNLDMMGIAAASGSACTSKTLEASHVLIALGLKHEEAHGSVVFTLGHDTNKEQIDYVVQVVPGIVDRLRAMSPLTP